MQHIGAFLANRRKSLYSYSPRQTSVILLIKARKHQASVSRCMLGLNEKHFEHNISTFLDNLQKRVFLLF